jgi:hypothetical protein
VKICHYHQLILNRIAILELVGKLESREIVITAYLVSPLLASFLHLHVMTQNLQKVLSDLPITFQAI